MTLRENKDFISDMATDDERRTLLATRWETKSSPEGSEQEEEGG